MGYVINMPYHRVAAVQGWTAARRRARVAIIDSFIFILQPPRRKSVMRYFDRPRNAERRNRQTRAIRALTEALEPRRLLSSTPTLLKDINATPRFRLTPVVEVGDRIYYGGADAIHGS